MCGKSHIIIFFAIGFDSRSVRELCLRATPRNFKTEIYKETFAASMGILIPLYEKENDLLLLGNKGDSTIQQIGLGPNNVTYFSKYTGEHIKYFLAPKILKLAYKTRNLYIYV